LEEFDGHNKKTLGNCLNSATDAIAKVQHTITMRVANAIDKATEKFQKRKKPLMTLLILVEFV
jgi:hypothetical protein